jgi:hypothetical protein
MQKKSILLTIAVAALLCVATPSTFAHSYSQQYDLHPLRILAYPFHAVGVYIEQSVTRPLHWLSSQENWDVIMGHQPREGDEYWAWRIGPEE